MRSILIALALWAGTISPAAANIIQVPSAHATIQAGINAAVSGDTVQVAPGTYTGPSNRNLDFTGKNILLRSSAGAATTIIDCQTLARGIRFHTGETAAAIVQGFTIRNGLANGTFGGGILIESGANPTIRNCRFTLNHANTGGGIYVSSGVALTDCDFEDNSADNFGGGVYGESAIVQATRCSFTQNEAGFGGGVYAIVAATVNLTDCTFTENAGANLAGGLYASASSVTMRRCGFVLNTGRNGAGAYLLDGTASVDSCSFTSNTSIYGGGGMLTKNVEALTVRGCIFENNIASTIGPAGFESGGGGLRCGVASSIVVPPAISDCLFSGNQALGASGGGMSGGSRGLVERCVFTDNQADNAGGGAQCFGRLHNCVFERNTASHGGGLESGYELIDCRFTDNHADLTGGGCQPSGFDGGCTIIRCEFSGNSAPRGGGMSWPTLPLFVMEDSRFSDNNATQGGGMYASVQTPSSVTGCTFEGNTAAMGGAVYLQGTAVVPLVSFSGSTFVDNDATTAGGMYVTIPVQVENTIIAFGTQGEAVACAGNGVAVMSCSDIYGNAGGNWTGCISDQVGINGNFALDPRFCNVGGRDFRLAQTSPCTAANAPAGCGLIGAYPIGCATPIGIADAGAPAVTPILRVTPNPMRGAGMIEWTGVGGRETELRLYDVAGRIVARRVERGAGGGLPWSTLVGAGGMPSGVYFLEVGEGRAVDARVRLVVVR
jgi:hypothetical protein